MAIANGTFRIIIAMMTMSLLASHNLAHAQESEFFPSEAEQVEESSLPSTSPENPVNKDDSTIDQDSIFFPPDDDNKAGQGIARNNAPKTPVAVPKNMTRTVKRQLDKVIFPAIVEGRDLDFLQAMGVLVSKLDANGLADLEAYSQGHGFSIRDHFTLILVKAIEQQEEIPVPELKIDVIEFVNTGLRKRIESELGELKRHPVMAEEPELPNTWHDRELLFWEVHVWKNRLANVKKLSQYGKVIQQHLLARAEKKNDQPTINRLKPAVMQDFKVQQNHRRLIEGEALLRIAELEKVTEALEMSEDFEERISAAFALAMHSHFLDKTFAAFPPGSFDNPVLNDEGTITRYKDLVAAGRESGQNVIEKALLLRQGAHWWFRGRYGAGPLAFGLLKSKRAMDSKLKMFELYMPKERPKPIASVYSDDTVSPGYDRRHYYTWAVEKRDLVKSSSRIAMPQNATSSSTSTQVAGSQQSRFL